MKRSLCVFATKLWPEGELGSFWCEMAAEEEKHADVLDAASEYEGHIVTLVYNRPEQHNAIKTSSSISFPTIANLGHVTLIQCRRRKAADVLRRGSDSWRTRRHCATAAQPPDRLPPPKNRSPHPGTRSAPTGDGA